jgi:hypothetical protein
MATRGVTVTDLPESPKGEFLFCQRCGAEWSATRGDYFWKGSEPFTCRGPVGQRHRKTNLKLVRRLSRLVQA